MHGAIVFRRHRSPQERIDTERTEVIRGDEERTRVMTFTSPNTVPVARAKPDISENYDTLPASSLHMA